MYFDELAKYYRKLEEISGRLEMTAILAELFKECNAEEVVIVSYMSLGKLGPDWETKEFGLSTKLVLKLLSKTAGYSLIEIEEYYNKVGDIGDVAEFYWNKRRQATLFSFGEDTKVSIVDMWNAFQAISEKEGAGSQTAKHNIISPILSKLDPLSVRFFCKIITNQMRLGVRTATLIDGMVLAKLGNTEEKEVMERGVNLLGDLGITAKILWEKGIQGIKEIQPEPLTPIQNMAAHRVSTAFELYDKIGAEGSMEYKYDGIRVQMHSDGKTVRVFSRRLENMTPLFPEVIEALKEIFGPINFILEGEVVAVDKNGRILPFQYVARRRRKTDIDKIMKEIPVNLFVFDILYVEGKSFIELDFRQRREELEKRIPDNNNIIRKSSARWLENEEDISNFLENALTYGCEGIMGKKADEGSAYRAGKRGWSWVKLKPDYVLGDSFDLVIVGAKYGSGKRAGTYGTLLLACYDDKNQQFKSITQLGSGFKDEDLVLFEQTLTPLKVSEKPKELVSEIEPDVWFTPKYVVEVIGTELSQSTAHTACRGFSIKNNGEVAEKLEAFYEPNKGLAIRFPRIIKKEFLDKTVEQATTEEEVWNLFEIQLKKRLNL